MDCDEDDDFFETDEEERLELERETLFFDESSFEDELRDELLLIDGLSPVMYLKIRPSVEPELFVFEDLLILIFGEEG